MNRVRVSMLAIGLLWSTWVLAADGLPEPSAVGKRIYRDGMLASGELLTAQVTGGVPLSGREAACETCHRRSGLGGAEGPTVIRPLTVPGFFAGQGNERRYARSQFVTLRQPHYTLEAFDRALREGRAADGRALSPLMPRYALDAASLEGLRTYLSGVAASVAPGVTATDMHFATIVTPDADPAARSATLRVLETMFEARNAGTRSERHRHRAGVESMHVDWRHWVLHVWQLTGDPSGWPEQLQRLYDAQPVFVVLSGSGQRWQPIHDFCEAREIPCLFPNVDAPGRQEPGRYNLYLSRGVLLEAEVMVEHLAAKGWQGPVVQLRRDDPVSATAARAFEAAWRRRWPAAELHDVVVPDADSRLDALNTGRLATAAAVMWLGAAAAEKVLGDLPAQGHAPRVASGTLLGSALPRRASGDAEPLWVAWPFALPTRGAHRDRALDWLAGRGIRDGDRRTLLNTYVAVTVAGDSIAHLANNYSRDYLIELIEHNADKSLSSGALPRLGLGPGQRYLSKGAYLARLHHGVLDQDAKWIVP